MGRVTLPRNNRAAPGPHLYAVKSSWNGVVKSFQMREADAVAITATASTANTLERMPASQLSVCVRCERKEDLSRYAKGCVPPRFSRGLAVYKLTVGSVAEVVRVCPPARTRCRARTQAAV